MRAGSVDGTRRQTSASVAIRPPVWPVMATVKSPSSRAFARAAQTFLLFPEVEIPTNTSPGWAESFNLPFEHFVVTPVIGDGGQDRSVGGKGDGRKGATRLAEASD